MASQPGWGWEVRLEVAVSPAGAAQSCTLPYRGCAIRIGWPDPTRLKVPRPAEYNLAIQQSETLRYV